MNKPLRHVSIVLTVLFVALFASITYFQVIAQPELSSDSRNARAIYNEYGKHRGSIVVAGEAIAYSVKTDNTYGYQRNYLHPELYAGVTGYYSILYGFSGIEKEMNTELSGDADSLFYDRLSTLISGRSPQGASVELTIDPKVQSAAAEALGDRKGAVVALDASDGAILALYSSPSYDPNQLASHDSNHITQVWQELNNDPNRPMVNRAIAGDLYPPGSVFKLLVAAAALDSGDYDLTTEVAGPGEYQLPNTSTKLANFINGDTTPCGPDDKSTLTEALKQSCNTTFAILGNELGEDYLKDFVKEYGFEHEFHIPMPATASKLGADLDPAQVALSSIGQYETRVTPLQMAMVSASFANDGVVMEPQLVESIRTADLREVHSFVPKRYSQPLSAANAQNMRTMMQEVVQSGTAVNAQIPGVEVGGKTGTAEWASQANAHAWFTGYAILGDKKVAVAVIVEEGGYGGSTAAPIARTVLQAAIER